MPSAEGKNSPEGIHTGEHAPYRWLTDEKHELATVVRLCPEIVIGKHVAITATDSGEPWLTDEQTGAGWYKRDKLLYTPRLSATSDLICGVCAGFDEWYVFDESRELGTIIEGNPFDEQNGLRPGRLIVFVNLYLAIHKEDSVSMMFWRQLEWIKPQSYLSDGDRQVTFVTSDHPRFESVLTQLISEPSD
jgi:hypothetical protein